MRKNVIFPGVLFALYLCFTATAFGAETIKYIGSSTVGKFMQEAQNVYMAASLAIDTNGESGAGENATAAGMCDIGGVARDVKPAIMARGVKKHLIGKDAIGAWVNKNNPVSSLTMAQLKEIFTGKIKNWQEVGGKDAAITVYIVNPQSATRKVFGKYVLGEAGKYQGNIRTIRPDQAILDRIAADENGIGHLSFALGSGHAKENQVKRLDIGGQKASVDNPSYPITRPLYLITKGEANGASKKFIDWTLSDAGQAVVKKYFVGR